MKLLIFITSIYWNVKTSNNLPVNELLLPSYKYGNYTTYFVNLIQVYEVYHRLFHIDSTSKDVFDETVRILRKSNHRYPFTVFNYDELNDSELFIRPNTARILHIIYTRNPEHWKIFTQPYKITYKDVTIFVSTNSSEESRIMYQNADLLKYSGKILLVEILNASFSGIHLYQMCHYCGNLSRTLMPIIGKPSLTTLFPFNHKNLNQHQLKLVFIQNYPYCSCQRYVDEIYLNLSFHICTALGGIESHMVKLISKKMNFKFKVYTWEWENASFYNMLTRVKDGEYDLAFGSISMTFSRRQLIQFTISYNMEEYNLLYKNTLSFNDVLGKFFAPFSDQLVWTLFLTSQFLLVFLLVLIQRLEKGVKRRKSLIECFWLLLQIPLEQSIPSTSSPSSYQNTPPRQSSSFIATFTKYTSGLLLLWCLTCLVLCSAYKGVTLSTLVRPPKTEPEGMSELMARGYGLAASYKSTDIVQDLLYGVLYPPKVFFSHYNCEVYSKAQTSKMAMLNEWSILQFQVKKNCPRADPQIEDQMIIARKAVKTAGHAWATQPGAAFKVALDYYLSLILSGGLYVKWSADHTSSESGEIRPFRISRATQKHMRVISLPLRAFYPLFIVFSFGLIASCTLLALELIYYYVYQSYTKKQKNKKSSVNTKKS